MTDSGLETISEAAEPSTARTAPSHPAQVDPENPGSTDAPSNRSAQAASRSRWRRPLLILGPVALVIGALGVYLATGRYVTEEDAYVQAVNVSISPQVAGQVVTIATRSNTPIKKNAPLFNIDPEPYRSRLTQVAQAKATADYAQTTFDRQQELFDRGAAPRATLDAAIRDLQVANANLASLQREAAAALAQLGGNPDMPIDQQSTMKQALAAVDLAARNLRLTSIVAPFDGIPNNVESIAVGAFLNAGQSP